MNESSFDRCRIDNVDLHTDLMMLYDLAELAPLHCPPICIEPFQILEMLWPSKAQPVGP